MSDLIDWDRAFARLEDWYRRAFPWFVLGCILAATVNYWRFR